MTQKSFNELSDDEVTQELKKLKSNKILIAFLIGIFIGISVYSAVKNGFGFFTFFPLIFAYILLKNGKKHKALEEELNSRKLKE